MRKKVDSRIRTLVENCVKTRQRSLFVIVGDKGRDQVVNLHYMLSKTVVKARPSVLWCYKKDLYLSSHKRKRMKQIQKMSQRGLLDPEKEDPFSLFVASTNIRYCYYSETHKVLGNTYGMLVLQDFEALTPNLLARTVETVEGGGIVVLLLSTLQSLTQLYNLTMDAHSRLATESHQQVKGRFNERFILSLANCPSCILMDDELNILPTSTLVADIKPATVAQESPSTPELRELSDSLADTQPAGSLVAKCRTLDQARAVVTFLDAASEKTLRSTVALTAARGRGKSAALGLAIAGALGLGYSNIFVTAPSPENLRTLFEFVFKGLDALDYKEHLDYDLVESTNPAFGKAIVRVNVFRTHRQTVQYIQPQHAAALAQAELLVIDEAAAIPLPMVKSLLGPYLVFLCSTVNGYEGTGRSLSLKLIHQLRQQGGKVGKGVADDPMSTTAGRTFREVILADPIRYALGDQVEKWLNGLLCLDAAEHVPPVPTRLPHPDECQLYYVERDTLFSFHRASETFLQRMMSLYVASHYKNSPNDLLLMSDAPAHHLFALLGPVDSQNSGSRLPDVLAVVQVALEGAISRNSAVSSLAAGQLPQGDLIPWNVAQQFQDAEFAGLSGARVVRIAVHPELARGGYGTRALQLLRQYYEGHLAGLDSEDEEQLKSGNSSAEEGDDDDASETSTGGSSSDDDDEEEDHRGRSNKKKLANNKSTGANASSKDDNKTNKSSSNGTGNLLGERVTPRRGLPPLLVALQDRAPERLHYLGVSCGLTQDLYSFWRKSLFAPVYLRQTPSDTTGEHTVIMLRALSSPDLDLGPAALDDASPQNDHSAENTWLAPFVRDFRARFSSLLAGAFRDLPPALALSILDPRLSWSAEEIDTAAKLGLRASKPDGTAFSPFDLKRLQAYSNNLVDHHLVLDLVAPIAGLYFAGRLPATLTYTQAAILVTVGLQHREISALETALGLPASQVLALFNKALRRLHAPLKASEEAEADRSLPRASSTLLLKDQSLDAPTLDEEMETAAAEVRATMREKLKPEDLEQYAINVADEEFAAAAGGKEMTSGRLSVKATVVNGDEQTPVRATKPAMKKAASTGHKKKTMNGQQSKRPSPSKTARSVPPKKSRK